jgi:hypothetical protein
MRRSVHRLTTDALSVSFPAHSLVLNDREGAMSVAVVDEVDSERRLELVSIHVHDGDPAAFPIGELCE